MKIILEKATKHFTQNLPFVLYKKPNENIISAFFQENDTLYEVNDFTEKGFVFASFDGSQTVLIPEEVSEKNDIIFQNNIASVLKNSPILNDELEKKKFKNLISKGIKAIENKQLKKVVLSRKQTLNITNFDLFSSFQNLVQLYPTTFVSCFFHPKIGTWLGATPEQLLKVSTNKFQTIALAGTQKDQNTDKVVWQKKEQEEQQFVTDYIVERVQNLASDLVISKPYSIKAGNIWHIKTDISGTLNSSSNLQKVIQLLHPTPAVCGLPKEEAKAFILENENYDRKFYTGFLGELNCGKKSDLFVNLRCMEMEVASKSEMTRAHLYMGCGITKDSAPENEWEESVNKSATMKKILDFKKKE